MTLFEKQLKLFWEKYTTTFQYNRDHKPYISWKKKWDGGDDINEYWISPKELESFLSQIQQEIKDAVLAEIEGRKKKENGGEHAGYSRVEGAMYAFDRGYNSALSDLSTHLKEIMK